MPNWRKPVLALTEAQYRELYEAKGLGCRRIGAMHGITMQKVWRDLKHLGIKTRAQRVHEQLDRHFFDVIDTDDKAYALGLICADGSIAKNGRRIRINLQARDREVLDRLLVVAGGGHVGVVRRAGAVNTGRGYSSEAQETIGLRWDSHDMCAALLRYGVCPGKSRALPEITAPPAKHMRAFVRGLVDGDGCLHYGKAQAIINFTNLNESLLGHVRDYWERLTGANVTVMRGTRADGRINKSVVMTGPRAIALAADLYLTDESAVAIPRKRELARRLQSWRKAAKVA